ncbi:hypothetical protein ACTOB_003430 [Actinoplanes oblitus]|uniref:Uncharacterized protein n=1 Tax=Actinoplanes oblitus TaxID=3040509 RepID=A0ABY8WRP5_9ACTN|nr:hypothetical protein [Actinoplanes oblitus]WIM99768.1 hypothetical protein ACTOB_003430 [Actinoplanes oblitus]
MYGTDEQALSGTTANDALTALTVLGFTPAQRDTVPADAATTV